MSMLPPPHAQPPPGSQSARRLPPPPHHSAAANVDVIPASLGRRLGALVVDVALAAPAIYGLFNLVSVVFGNMFNSWFNDFATTMNPDATKEPMIELSGVAVVCVFVGLVWLIWTLAAWSDATTPGKQMFHLSVVDAGHGHPVDFRRMFTREVLAKLMLGLLWGVSIAIGIVLILVTKRRTAIWDLMADTVVVHGYERRRALSRREIRRL